jgi:hypothetical protein
MKLRHLLLFTALLVSGCNEKNELEVSNFSSFARSEIEVNRWRLYVQNDKQEELLTEGVIRDGKLITVFEVPVMDSKVKSEKDFSYIPSTPPYVITITGERSCLFSGVEVDPDGLGYVIERVTAHPKLPSFAIIIEEPVDLEYLESILQILFKNDIKLWIGVDYLKKLPKPPEIIKIVN